MLKGIAPCVSPELLKVLAEMGHGDELILADAHFPGHTMNARVLRADGLGISALLDGILPLFELDGYADPLVMMAAVKGDELDPAVEAGYMEAVHRHVPGAKPPGGIKIRRSKIRGQVSAGMLALFCFPRVLGLWGSCFASRFWW